MKRPTKPAPDSSFRRKPESSLVEHKLGPGLRRDDAGERWQRTVRYGWDKGGAKGGRK